MSLSAPKGQRLSNDRKPLSINSLRIAGAKLAYIGLGAVCYCAYAELILISFACFILTCKGMGDGGDSLGV